MTTLHTELKQQTTLAMLTEHSADDLLAAFLGQYNQQNADWDALLEDNETMAKRLAELEQENKAQGECIAELERQNEKAHLIGKTAEEIAHKAQAIQIERDRLRITVSELQKELTTLKGGENPKKLREQVKRLKEKGGEKDKKIKRLETEAKQYRHELTQTRQQQQQGFAKIAELKRQLDLKDMIGVYHNEEHHLIFWPQPTAWQDESGEKFKCISLLYMHQSGRAGLMRYNPNTSEVTLCEQPRGGLRPSKELKAFATDWLYKVNVTQNGEVKEEDLIPVNYNAEFDR